MKDIYYKLLKLECKECGNCVFSANDISWVKEARVEIMLNCPSCGTKLFYLARPANDRNAMAQKLGM